MDLVNPVVFAQKLSLLQFAVTEFATYFTEKKAPNPLQNGDHHFCCRVRIWVEETWPCPIYMDCFKLQLPTDARDVLEGARVTSSELDPCPPWLVKEQGGGHY